MSTHKRYHRNTRKTAKLIPKPLSQYFPKCARANQNTRIDLISHGSAYAFGSADHEKNGKYALWAFVMAAFEDEAYYNEIGREPLSPGASNYRDIQITLFFDSLPLIKKLYYRKLMGLMEFYLENCYFKQPQHFFLLIGTKFRRQYRGFMEDILPEIIFWIFLFVVGFVLFLILK